MPESISHGWTTAEPDDPTKDVSQRNLNDHTISYSGLTAGHVLRASGAAAADFAAIQDSDVPTTIARDAEVTAAIAALSTVYQPLDADLTAIAALSTTAYGRALLALADAAAGRTALGLGTAAVSATGDFDAAGSAAAAQAASQPVDSDLTAIAALTTTAFGRGLLELADAAALLSAAGAAAAGHTHSGGAVISGLDRPPSSAHAKDDEFEGSSLDAKWTIPASSGTGQETTATVENGVVAITPTATGSSSTGKRFFGISQPAPTGSFSVMAKLGEAGLGSDRRHGMFIAVAGSTGHVFGPFAQDGRIAVYGVTTTSTTGDWSAVDAFSINNSSLLPAGTWPQPSYVKIVWNASTSTLTFYMSLNGLVWILYGTRASMSQPTTFGVCLYSNGASVRADDVLACDWIRVTEP